MTRTMAAQLLRVLSSRICAFIGFLIALAVYAIIFQHVFPGIPFEDVKNERVLPEGYDYKYLENLQLPNSYQCALVWLRLPKTASTAVIKRFVAPLAKSANFVNSNMGPNTCITHLGGCTDFWGGYQTSKTHWASIDDYSIAPPYGVSVYDKTGRDDGNNQRCFPDEAAKPKLYCWEFDRNHSTIFYGPHHSSKQKKRKNKFDVPLQIYENNTFMTAKFDLYPSLHTHVAIDTSLFGWLLPQSPMVFSTFRDPVDRLLSSFHYGIQFGGDLPGQVRKCKLPGVKDLEDWQSRVVSARELAFLNDLTLYQKALREYLDGCGHAVDNVYVQFLDPKTKNVDVALLHLNKYVIVGMQTDLDESLRRWKKIVMWSCREHPKATWIGRALTNPEKIDSHYRESTSLINGTGNELASPTIEQIDPDLQQLIRTLTVGDEVIFRRAKELYEEQGKWFRLKESEHNT